MGGIFSIVGTNTGSERRCNSNVANRKKTQEKAPSKGQRSAIVV